MLNLGESIRLGQREMAKTIVEGLRPGARFDFQDAGDDGDIEDEVFERKAPGNGNQKRRSQWENLLSVRLIPLHLTSLITLIISRGSAIICES